MDLERLNLKKSINVKKYFEDENVGYIDDSAELLGKAELTEDELHQDICYILGELEEDYTLDAFVDAILENPRLCKESLQTLWDVKLSNSWSCWDTAGGFKIAKHHNASKSLLEEIIKSTGMSKETIEEEFKALQEAGEYDPDSDGDGEELLMAIKALHHPNIRS